MSGLKIGGAMVASLTALALIGIAYFEIVNVEGKQHAALGWLLMATMASILALTIQYWRHWFFFIPGYLGVRSSLGLLLGWFSPRGFVFVGFPVLVFAMAAMSFRFSKPARIPAFDRITLLLVAACLLAALSGFLSPEPKVTVLIFTAVGDLFLLLSQIRKTARVRKRTSQGSVPPTAAV
jgi:hypothetical protein